MAPEPVPTMLGRAFQHALEDPTATDEISTAVLDAAYEQFRRAGVHRTTMDDVARAAGLARITIYRRFATKEALVEQVVRREFRRYLEQFHLEVAAATTASERVVLGFVSAMTTFRTNSLISAMVSAEPGTLVSSMIAGRTESLTIVREFLAGQLRQEQAAGHVCADLDSTLVADVIVRICTSYLITPGDLVDLDDPEEVAALARQFIVPMLTPPSGES
ncbi:MAG: helix-turn-helix domain containing protein [Propionibacteriales bacterium]|nr:helix-turn-helix domain containing protein [Propionibacteriales bacterium]